MKKKTTSIIAVLAFAVIVVTLLMTTFAYAHSTPVVWSVQITTTPEQPVYPPPNCENNAPYPPPYPSPYPEPYNCDYFPIIYKIGQFVDEIFGEP